MLAALLGPMCPVPVVLAEAVPSWIGPLDVVVAHTADAADADARRFGRPGGGPRARRSCCPRRATGRSRPRARAGCGWWSPASRCRPAWTCRARSPSGSPRSSALDLLPTPLSPGLDELADTLDGEAERNAPGNEAFMNPAKSLALRLAEHTPLLWGTDPLAAAVAEHAAASLATHAGVVAHAADIAQAATATALVRRLDAGAGRDIFHDPFADDPVDRGARRRGSC